MSENEPHHRPPAAGRGEVTVWDGYYAGMALMRKQSGYVRWVLRVKHKVSTLSLDQLVDLRRAIDEQIACVKTLPNGITRLVVHQEATP